MLCKKIDLVDDISELTLPTSPRYIFNKENENDTIETSNCLKAKAEIPKGAFESNVNTSLFYDIDISSDSDKLKAAKSSIEAATLNWLDIYPVYSHEAFM